MSRVSFWDLVDRAEAGCWRWRGPLRDGQASFPYTLHGVRGRWSVQTLAYHLAKAPVPLGQRGYAGCGEALCVNPAHLTLQPAPRSAGELRAERREVAARAYAEFAGSEADPETIRQRYGLSKDQAYRLFSGRSYRPVR